MSFVPDMRGLRGAAVVYGVGLVLHTADHIRRGPDVLSSMIKVTGTIATLAGVLAIALVLVRHRRAPQVAGVVGILVAIGIVRAHLLPFPNSTTDTFPGAVGTGVTAFSWITAVVELAGALAVGMVAAHGLLRRRRRRTAPVGG